MLVESSLCELVTSCPSLVCNEVKAPLSPDKVDKTDYPCG